MTKWKCRSSLCKFVQQTITSLKFVAKNTLCFCVSFHMKFSSFSFVHNYILCVCNRLRDNSIIKSVSNLSACKSIYRKVSHIIKIWRSKKKVLVYQTCSFSIAYYTNRYPFIPETRLPESWYFVKYKLHVDTQCIKI